MSYVGRLKDRLLSARGFTHRVLEDFKQPSDWVQQVCDQSNHALWFVGHIANTDNFFVSLLAPERAATKQGFQETFGMGSSPTPDLSAYPPVEEVRSYMDDRRETLLSILDGLNEEDMARKTPEGAPDFLSDFGQVFETAIWHEAIHTGQLTMIRRSLGHKPIAGG